jgi:hypothetical protein
VLLLWMMAKKLMWMIFNTNTLGLKEKYNIIKNINFINEYFYLDLFILSIKYTPQIITINDVQSNFFGFLFGGI